MAPFQHLAGVQKVIMGWSNRDTDRRGRKDRGHRCPQRDDIPSAQITGHDQLELQCAEMCPQAQVHLFLLLTSEYLKVPLTNRLK